MPDLEALPIDALDLAPDEVSARLRRARERGQPFFPWDDVSPEAWRASLRAIQAAVRERLSSGDRGAGSAAPAGARAARLEAPTGARALGVAAFTSGCGPLLGHWIEAGAVEADADVSRILLLHLEHGRLRAARLGSALRNAAASLAGAGVEPAVVKGMHTAYAVFPEPGVRPFSDIDLVVRPAEIPSAESALAAAGFTPRPVLARPYCCEWAPPAASTLPRSLELTHEDNPWTVDLHASFDRDFGGVRTVGLVLDPASATETARIAGAPVRVLRQPWLAAYLAAHASQELKNLTLVRLLELVWVLRGLVDWKDLMAALERAHAAPFVYPALALAERLASGTVPAGVLAQLAAVTPARVRRIVARLEPATAQRIESVSLEEHFMWAVGPLDHLRRLRRVLWPTWAGSPADVLRVQATRARQLLARRVSVSDKRGSARG
jgi:hypothetical protein